MTARLLKDPATANCRIFVGHLQTDDTNKVELEQHFSKYGIVIGSLMNRGFGFVQFENEQSAQDAIQNEDGQMFKGRRIDVRPAKKDTVGSAAPFSGDADKSKSMAGNNTFSVKNNQFMPRNNSFGDGGGGGGGNQNQNQNPNASQNFNQDFGQRNNQDFNQKNLDFNTKHQDFGPASSGKNQNLNSDTSFEDKTKPVVNSPIKEQFNSDNNQNQNQDGGDFQKFSGINESFNSNNQTMDSNDSFNSGSQGRGSGNSQFGGNQNDTAPTGPPNPPQNNQNRGGNNQFAQANQNRPANQNNQNQNNQNRNQNSNQGGNQGQGGNTGNSSHRARGSRGGKNKNKNRDNSGGGNSFRDRSPLNRGPRGNDDKGRDWEHNMMQRGNNFGRDSFSDNGRFDDRYKDPMGIPNYGRGIPPEYIASVAEKNDCEIIVVNKSLTEYAEAIEARLKKMGLTVDLLFPNEEVPLSRVLGNIASRGCLYAVVVTQTNLDHTSMTLNILHGLPQEHRNMPVDDALNLINRDFSNFKSGGRSVPFNTPFASDRHPDAIQVLLNMLADNHQLTVLQYDRVIKYLEIKREEQVQIELGDTKDLGPPSIAVSDPKQAELQSRILNILNSNKPTAAAPVPSPVPAPTPVPVPSANWGTAVSSTASATSASSTTVTPSPLLNDPTVQKALDSLLQGNLLKSIGDPQPTSVSQPLFAAFPNIGRF